MTTRRVLALWAMAVFFLNSAMADDKKEPGVSGLYTGNGKAAKLAFASTHKSDFDTECLELVFTEKDHAQDKKPSTGALFGKYGSALILTVKSNGDIVGCSVAHQDLVKSGFSSVGKIKTIDYKVAGGKVTGQATTNGVVETFGEKWEVKLKFEVAVP